MQLHPGTPQEAGMSERQLDLAAEYVAGKVLEGTLPLAEILVARRGRIVHRSSHVHRRLQEEGVRIEPSSIFALASFTKVLTATLVMQQVERGSITLEVPVAQYIPDFGSNGNESVTPRHLLSHSSGISEEMDGPRPESLAELLQHVYQRPLAFEPGTRSSYSTVGYAVLAELLRLATGKGLEELGTELLFAPLGMTSSHLAHSEEWRERVVPVFGDDLNAIDYKPGWAMGGTGGYSSTSDVAVLCQMMLNGGSYGNSRVLSPVTVKRMTERQTPWWDTPERLSRPDKYSFVSKGLGWMVRGNSHYRGSDIMSPRCRWSTIMSVVNRSGKMSVHERIDIDPERTGKAPSAQRYPGRSDISG